MAVTMRQVAEAAGVSIATVSFVVNNTKPVTPETRRRIERAMAELGFRPNIVARALASRRTQILALVTPLSRLWPGAATREFILGAAQAAKDSNHHLVIWPVGNDGDELVALVGQKLVDGVLLMSVQLDDARVEALRGLDTPFTLIGRTRDLTGLDYVDVDIAASMRMAMDHLAGLGHRTSHSSTELATRRVSRDSVRTSAPRRPTGSCRPNAASARLCCTADRTPPRVARPPASCWPPRRARRP